MSARRRRRAGNSYLNKVAKRNTKRARKQRRDAALEYGTLEPRRMLAQANGMLVGGNLDDGYYFEGDHPSLIVLFNQLPADTYSATISIGNRPSQNVVVQQSANDPGSVFVENFFAGGRGQIPFVQDGQNTIDVTLYSSLGLVAGHFSKTVDVANVAPVVHLESESSLGLVGEPYQLEFNIVDVGSDVASLLSIDWGDGTQDEIVNPDQGTVSHVYLEPGSFQVITQVADNDGVHPRVAMSTEVHIGSENVADPAVTVELNDQVEFVNGVRFEGTVATLSQLQLPVSDYSAKIYWADGQVSDGNLVANRDGSIAVRGGHTHWNFGDREFRVELMVSGQPKVMATAPVKVWSASEIAYANHESTGPVQLGSFEFLAPTTFEQTFLSFVSSTHIPGGFEERYQTPDSSVELIYREVIGQETEIVGVINGVEQMLTNQDPDDVPEANNDTVFENRLGSIRVAINREHPERANLLRMKRATFDDAFSASVDWADGSPLSTAWLELDSIYHRNHFMTVHVFGEHTYSDRSNHVAEVHLNSEVAWPIRDHGGQFNYVNEHQGHVSFAYGGPTLFFESAFIESHEGETVFATIGISETSTQDISFRLATHQPSIDGADYLFDYRMDEHELTIPAGQDSISFPIRHFDDGLDEEAERYFIDLQSVISGNAIISNDDRMVGTILKPRAPEIEFVQKYREGVEGQSYDLRLRLTQPIDQPFDVIVAPVFSFEHARIGQDYRLNGAGVPVVVSFAANQMEAVIDVDLIDDGSGTNNNGSGGAVTGGSHHHTETMGGNHGEGEGSETFFLTITNSGPAFYSGESFEGLIRETNSVPSELQIIPKGVVERSGPEGTVLEIDFRYLGPSTVTAVLSPTVGAADESLDFRFVDSGNQSFAADSRTLTIVGNGPTPVTETIHVQLLDDRIAEPIENLIVNLESVFGAWIKPADNGNVYDRYEGIIAPSDLTNSAPRFVSENLTAAYVNSTYEYQSKASDDDGDSLVYQMGHVVWPEGFKPTQSTRVQFEYQNNGAPDQRGIYTWTPPAELAGKTVTIEEFVWDGVHEPVVRSFEVYVHPEKNNHAPNIVSEPARTFRSPLQNPPFDTNPNVAPDVVNVTLAGGEQVEVNVNFSTDLQGEATADIIFVVDRSQSMNRAIEWLAGSGNDDGALLRIENELVASGITNNRFGLVVFTQSTSGTVLPPLVQGVRPVPVRLAVASGAQDWIEFNEYVETVGFDGQDYWGNAQDVRTFLQLMPVFEQVEPGQAAIARLIDGDPQPGSLFSQESQYRYDFRGDAVIDFVMVTNEDSDHYSHEVQTSIAERLIGNPDVSADDIVFTSILNGGFTRNDGNGNVDRFFDSGPEWSVDGSHLVVAPASPETGPSMAIFDVGAYMEEVITEYGPESGSETPLVIELFHSWSVETSLTIEDLGAGYDQNARVVFGAQTIQTVLNEPQLPDEYWYLEADVESNSWLIGSTGTALTYEFATHAGAIWPALETGEEVMVELRQIAQKSVDGTFYFPRFDLFLNDAPIGSVAIPDYMITTPSRRSNSIGFMGVGANNSGAKFDALQMYAFDFVSESHLARIHPDMPTPKDFSSHRLPARLGFRNDFGTVDGTSLDPELLGVDYNGAAYRIGSQGSFSLHENPSDGNHFINSGVHYAELSRLVGGSSWNIRVLQDGDQEEWDSFSNAFVDALKDNVVRQHVSLSANSDMVTDIQSVFDPAYPNGLSYKVTLTGNGNGEAFELRLLENGDNDIELERLPVFVNANYGHDFVVADAEDDEPYTVMFDPEYVNSDGQLLNHGAVLVDSGRSFMRSDRLLWTPPQVISATDFHFRVLVRDSAGQVGRKSWTVTVEPWNENNSPPKFDVEGLAIDLDDGDGVVGEPTLPVAEELRGFQYQFVAHDVDDFDQGRLRYFMQPTELASGAVVPVPSWLEIDYQTGLLSGRPGSFDLGKTHVTVVVSDGRLYYQDEDTVVDGRQTQTFAIAVNPRGHFNTAPFISPVSDLVVKGDETFSLSIEATDVDYDSLTYELLFGPEGMSIGNQSGIISWTPDSTQVGQRFPVTFAVSDGRASTTDSFELVVATPNRDPVFLTELPDGFLYREYDVELSASDADGNVVRHELIAGPDGMVVTPFVAGEAQALRWNQGAISSGRHLVGIRSNDGAGGIVDRYSYLTFNENGPPELIALDQPTWRTSMAETAWMTLNSKYRVVDFDSFALDRDSVRRGMLLDLSQIHEYETHIQDVTGDYWQYQIPIHWTPSIAGVYDGSVTVANDQGTRHHDFLFEVFPFVNSVDNRPPLIPHEFLGPFAQDSEVRIPLGVTDLEGHDFELAIDSDRFQGYDSDALENGFLNFVAPEAGIYEFRLHATERSDGGATGWGATQYKDYTLVISENAAPTVHYGNPGFATIDQVGGYVFELDIADPNPNDSLNVELNHSATAAGLSIDELAQSPGRFQLSWTQSDILDWVANRALPLEVPVVIDVSDNHGNDQQIAFRIPVYDPSQVATAAGDFDFTILAGRFWEMPLLIDNPGGRSLSFQLAVVDENGMPSDDPLPDGLVMSSDGVMSWLPSLDDLLGDDDGGAQNANQGYSVSLIATVANVDDQGQSVDVPLTIEVVDPAHFTNQYVPQIDIDSIRPPRGATAQQALVYTPLLENGGDNEWVEWHLDRAPAGMTIESDSGQINWTPTDAHVGARYEVQIRANSRTAGSTATFFVEVNGANQRPLIESTFPTVWRQADPFVLDLHARDPEGHALSYVILDAIGNPLSNGMSIDNHGRIEWDTPAEGSHDFLIRVHETHNRDVYSEQSLRFSVLANAINYEPLIVGTPHGNMASTESEFSFQFGVFDRDQGDVPFTFEIGGGPSHNPPTIDSGRFLWTPALEDVGQHVFEFSVTDTPEDSSQNSHTRYVSFELEVIENRLPVVHSDSYWEVPIAATFVHQLEVVDPDGGDLQYRVFDDGGLSGLYLNPGTGRILWQVPNDESLGPQEIVVAIEDDFGAVVHHPMTLTPIIVDQIAPSINYYVKDSDGRTVLPGDPLDESLYADYQFWIDVQDNRGIEIPDGEGTRQNGAWTVTANNTGGEPVVSGPHANGFWLVDLTAGNGLNQGLLEIEVNASDAAGNDTNQYYRYYVEDAASYDIGKLLNINAYTEPIRDRFEILGNANHTVNGEGVYDLKLISIEDPNDYVYLAKGEDANVTESVLGVVDGTLLPSGQYRLYLEVRCNNGEIQAVDERVIEIQNEARLGDLELSFSDLQVALGGYPIPFVRTYNSGLIGTVDDPESGFDSDFSAGWNLNLLNSKITVSHREGVTTDIGHAWADGTRVLVTLPDGMEHWFSFDPVEIGNSGVFLPYLNPDPGNSEASLSIKDVDERLRFVLDPNRNDGTYLSNLNGLPSIPANFGSAFVLETESGLSYLFDIVHGELLAIEDQNGAQVEIVPQGNDLLVRTRGSGPNNQLGQPAVQEVVIRRDSEQRILAIDDANENSVEYQYGDFDPASGDVLADDLQNLARVVRRSGETESYGYDHQDENGINPFERYLTEIFDASNVGILEAEYFDDVLEQETYGRLKSTANASGLPTRFGFDMQLPGGMTVRSTNNTGRALEEVRNSRGDLVRTVSLVDSSVSEAGERIYLVSVTRYNLRGLMTHQSKPYYVHGAENRFVQEPNPPETHPLEWFSITTYDDRGRVLTNTNSEGAVTTHEFDDVNGVARVIDPFGVTRVQISNPANGRLLESYTTDREGTVRLNHLRFEYNAFGQLVRQVQMFPDGTSSVISEANYNEDGFKVLTQTVDQNDQHVAYDRNGLPTHSWQIVSADEEADIVTAVNVNTYDPDGRVVASAIYHVRDQVVYDQTNFELLALKIEDYQSDTNVTKISETLTRENIRGQAIQTLRMTTNASGEEIWFEAYTLFDADGRVEYQMQEYETSVPVAQRIGTQTEYYPEGHPAEGSIRRTTQWLGMEIGIALVAGHWQTSVDDPGAVVSSIVNEFDSAGRHWKTTNFPTASVDPADGLTTTNYYNLRGQLTQVVNEQWNGAGDGKVMFVARTVFDDQDRLLLQTDTYREGEVVMATQTLYDAQSGLPYATVRLDNVEVEITGADDPIPNQTSFVHDGDVVELYRTENHSDRGRDIKEVGQTGLVTEWEYDSFGRRVATVGDLVVLADGTEARHRTELVLDDRGRTIVQRTNIRHDLSGRGEHDESEVQEIRFEYGARDNVIKTIFDDGSYRQSRYDSLGRRVAESHPVSSRTRLVWSGSERSFVTDELEPETIPTRVYEYDALGRNTAVVLPEVTDETGSQVRPTYAYGFDVYGQQSLIVDPLMRHTAFSYDSLGRLASRSLPLQFGPDGIPESGDETGDAFSESFQYDYLGREVLHVSFEGVHTRKSFDPFTGRMTKVEFFVDESSYLSGVADETIAYRYDDWGRAEQIQHFDGTDLIRTEAKTFTREGFLETLENDEGLIRYQYDVHGRVVEVAHYGSDFVVSGSDDFDTVTRYEYDQQGRLVAAEVHERGDRLVDADSETPGDQPDRTEYTYDLLGNLNQTVYSSGLIHEHGFDALNRLQEVWHWVDLDNDGSRGADEVRAMFDYQVGVDGRRIGLTETIAYETGDGNVSGEPIDIANVYEWAYDAAGRLVSETLASSDTELDYTDVFTWDAVGNRKSVSRDWGSEAADDYLTTYTYDANDRILVETKDYFSVLVPDERVMYEFGQAGGVSTQQTAKSVEIGGVVRTMQTSQYNLQGRLAVVMDLNFNSNGEVESRQQTEFEYDASGNRVATETRRDENGDETFDVEVRTEYLTDMENHTGYSQVLQEIETTPGGLPTKKTVYTLGKDQISQAIFAYVDTDGDNTPDDWDGGSTGYFGTDGHGDVRVLLNGSAKVVNDAMGIAQAYHFDAFGNLLNFADGVVPLTRYLYSGEAFDFDIDQQYLRARYYDSVTGRFNRLDPFAGNAMDPQSFHKYGYVHGDPIQGVDPTGEFGIIAGAFVLAAVAGSLYMPFLYGSLSMMVHKEHNQIPYIYELSAKANIKRGFRYAITAKAAYGRDADISAAEAKGFKHLRTLRTPRVPAYKAELFEDKRDGKILLAFAGTDVEPVDAGDIVTNIVQGMGFPDPQYLVAEEHTLDLIEEFGAKRLHLVGHSLGGGLAANSAMATRLNASTFNAAGVSSGSATNFEYDLSIAKIYVDAFRMQDDLLSSIQDENRTFPGYMMPDGVGQNYWIKNKNNVGGIEAHGMNYILEVWDMWN